MQFNSVVIDWLRQRKISESIQERFNVKAGAQSMLGECIVIPVYDCNGIFLFNKYRRSPLSDDGPKYMYDKGAHTELYGAWEVKDGMPHVLVTEGELDALVAWSANIPAVSSTGGSKAFPPGWASFFEGKEVTICFDNDQAGAEGAVMALDVVPHAKILLLPDAGGVKDLSDYAAKGGDVAELVKIARHYATLEDVLGDRAERLALWKSTHFHDAYIKRHAEKMRPKKERSPRIDGDDVGRAKGYPIDDLLQFNAARSAKCIWHNEKSASLHYYPEDNHVYCFGCGKSGDAIDVYRQINNCSFQEAVKFLKK